MKYYSTCKICVAAGKDAADATFEHNDAGKGPYHDHVVAEHSERRRGLPVTKVPPAFQSPRQPKQSPRQPKQSPRKKK